LRRGGRQPAHAAHARIIGVAVIDWSWPGVYLNVAKLLVDGDQNARCWLLVAEHI
jgi:hypothetical protein